MTLQKRIEKSLIRENNEVDAVEDEVMKDSVLAIASADFKEQDVLDLPLTSLKRAVDNDVGYPGKPVSRKKYRQDVGMEESLHIEEDDDVEGSDSLECGLDSDEGLIGFEEEEDDSLDEEDVGEEEDGSESDEDEIDDGDEVEDGSDIDLAPKSIVAETNDGNGSVKMFSDRQTDAIEVQKGIAVRDQLRIWESILECRIKLEPGLVAANQLYQTDRMSTFIADEKASGSNDADSALNALHELSSAWSRLQEQLAEQCTRSSGDKNVKSRKSDKIKSDDDDESITSSGGSGVESDEDNELESADSATNHPKTLTSKNAPVKPLSIEQSYSEFANFRDAEIEKWNEKAKVSTGRAAQRDFSAFDQSILKLIESILFDKYRLVRKTQLKRLDYEIYGKPKKQKTEDEGKDEDSQRNQAKKDLEYDPEIFDDGDFYQKLLRDFIEGKSSDDGISKHERKLMELHRLRIKMKRKIDTRATKGRKLRYIVHQKLVNFMAPVPTNAFSTETESQLLRSLFGQAVAN